MNIEAQIEAILFFKNEPVSISELVTFLKADKEEVLSALDTLSKTLSEQGIILLKNGEEVALGTNPKLSQLITDLQKEELSRDIGKAGLETLSIILYKSPVSRREIDYIRGVNSGYILRNLLVRGLITKENLPTERSYVYTPTLELFKFLGITTKEELPEYESAFKTLTEFVKSSNDEREQ